MSKTYQEYLKISEARRLYNQQWRAKQPKKDAERRKTRAKLAAQRWRKNNPEKALASSRRSDSIRKLNVNERARLRYAEDVKYNAAKKRRAKEWIERNHARWLLQQIKLRAKKTGIKFNITIDDLIVPKLCPVFGIPLKRGKGHSCDNSPTVDRIQSGKGYVKGNIAIISRFANSLKGKASAAQHRRIADWVDEQVRK